jgi:hypothetical protein
MCRVIGIMYVMDVMKNCGILWIGKVQFFKLAFTFKKLHLRRFQTIIKPRLQLTIFVWTAEVLRVPLYTVLKLVRVFPLFTYNLTICTDSSWMKILK